MTENYSLWMQPAEGSPVLGKLTREVHHLAATHGGPVFPPHVTLLPDIKGSKEDIIAVATTLARSLEPFRINFLNVSRGTFYYQCVYLLCAKDPAVMAAAAAARAAYSMTGSLPPYMPHLSLLYADKTDGEKDAIVEAEVARLFGEGADYGTLLTDPGFEVGSITLWYTPTEDKQLSDWCQVAEFPLGALEK